MLLALSELSLVVLARGPGEFAVPVSLVVLKGTLVAVPILVLEGTLALLLSL